MPVPFPSTDDNVEDVPRDSSIRSHSPGTYISKPSHYAYSVTYVCVFIVLSRQLLVPEMNIPAASSANTRKFPVNSQFAKNLIEE
jgi:hypothetical protein